MNHWRHGKLILRIWCNISSLSCCRGLEYGQTASACCSLEHLQPAMSVTSCAAETSPTAPSQLTGHTPLGMTSHSQCVNISRTEVPLSDRSSRPIDSDCFRPGWASSHPLPARMF